MKFLVPFLLLLGVPVAHAAFPDVQGHQHAYFIEHLRDRGVVEGDPDGTFVPERIVNRAEFVKMLTLAANVPLVQTDNPDCFTDFTGDEQWFWSYACSAENQNFLDGYPDGTFGGSKAVNLAEATKMTVEAWNLPLPNYVTEPEHWYNPYFDTAAGHGLFAELPNVPGMSLTRAEAAVLLSVLDPTFVDTRSSSSRSSVVSSASSSATSSMAYTPPVYHGALRITQQSLATYAAAPGSDDVLLLAAEATAGRQDVLITQMKFTADIGSLSSGTDYRLYYDSNLDGRAERLAAVAVPQNGQLTFSALHIPVPDGGVVPLELRGNVRQSGSPQSFSVQFATDQPDYVSGIGAVDGRELTGIRTDNGECPTESICWLAVHTEESRRIALSDAPGNLYVTQDATPARSRQLLLGSLSPILLRLDLFATNEDVLLTTLRIGGGTDSIESLQLYRQGETEPFATARESTCEVQVSGQYCANSDLSIRRDEEVTVLVRARLHTDVTGGSSGDVVSLALSAATDTNTAAVQAEGQESLSLLLQNNGNATAEGEVFIGRSDPGTNMAIVGNTHDVVAAKIATISNTHPDPDYSAIPVGISRFATFAFEAAPHKNTKDGTNAVVIEDITFNVTASNVRFKASSIEVFNPTRSGVAVSCSQSATTGVLSVTCSNLHNSDIQSVIGRGERIELSLRGNITNTQVEPGVSTLRTSIQGLGARGSGPIGWNDEVASWLWVDYDTSTVHSTLYHNQ